MTVHDIYFELNASNKVRMASAGVKLTKSFRHQDLPMPYYRLPEPKHIFVLAGINDMGQVFVAGFSLINRMRRIRKQWMQEAGCKYFIVSWNACRFKN